MTLPARRPATYEDLVALPEHLVGELVAGELHVSPRPAVPDAVGASALGATLLTRMQFGEGASAAEQRGRRAPRSSEANGAHPNFAPS